MDVEKAACVPERLHGLGFLNLYHVDIKLQSVCYRSLAAPNNPDFASALD